MSRYPFKNSPRVSRPVPRLVSRRVPPEALINNERERGVVMSVRRGRLRVCVANRFLEMQMWDVREKVEAGA